MRRTPRHDVWSLLSEMELLDLFHPPKKTPLSSLRLGTELKTTHKKREAAEAEVPELEIQVEQLQADLILRLTKLSTEHFSSRCVWHDVVSF